MELQKMNLRLLFTYMLCYICTDIAYPAGGISSIIMYKESKKNDPLVFQPHYKVKSMKQRTYKVSWGATVPVAVY